MLQQLLATITAGKHTWGEERIAVELRLNRSDAYEDTYARFVAGKRGADVRSRDPHRVDATLAPGTGL